MKSNFYINCDLGDTIYSLIILKRNNGGGIYFGPSHQSATTSHMQKKKLLHDLLQYQEYITSFGFCNKLFWKDYHDFKKYSKEDHKIDEIYFNKLEQVSLYVNKVPNLFWNPVGFEMLAVPLVELISERFQIDKSYYFEPWIKVPDIKIHDKKIIINRTLRYLTNHEIYIDIIKSHGLNNCGFIGTEEEYKNFSNITNIKIDYVETKNLLEAAIAIKNSNFFVGNQSACMALAEGLKHNVIQETYYSIPNCLFTIRENFYSVLPGYFLGSKDKYVGISLKNGQIGNIMFKDYESKTLKIGNREYKLRSIEI